MTNTETFSDEVVNKFVKNLPEKTDLDLLVSRVAHGLHGNNPCMP